MKTCPNCGFVYSEGNTTRACPGCGWIAGMPSIKQNEKSLPKGKLHVWLLVKGFIAAPLSVVELIVLIIFVIAACALGTALSVFGWIRVSCAAVAFILMLVEGIINVRDGFRCKKQPAEISNKYAKLYNKYRNGSWVFDTTFKDYILQKLRLYLSLVILVVAMIFTGWIAVCCVIFNAIAWEIVVRCAKKIADAEQQIVFQSKNHPKNCSFCGAPLLSTDEVCPKCWKKTTD